MSKFRKNNTKKALLFTLAFAVIITAPQGITLEEAKALLLRRPRHQGSTPRPRAYPGGGTLGKGIPDQRYLRPFPRHWLVRAAAGRLQADPECQERHH